MAVDVGSVRVGVAACDPAATVVFPVTVLARDGRGGRDLREIREMAAEREAIEIVVGWPRSLSGQEGPAARSATAYAEALASQGPPPVRLVDERLSTVEAGRRLQAAGRSSRQSRGQIDAAAAVVILEAALDGERSAGTPPGRLVEPPAGAAAGR